MPGPTKCSAPRSVLPNARHPKPRDELGRRRIQLSISDDAVAWLAREGHDPDMGARPLRHLIRTEIEDRLAAEILFGKLKKGGKARIVMDGDGLKLETDLA